MGLFNNVMCCCISQMVLCMFLVSPTGISVMLLYKTAVGDFKTFLDLVLSWFIPSVYFLIYHGKCCMRCMLTSFTLGITTKIHWSFQPLGFLDGSYSNLMLHHKTFLAGFFFFFFFVGFIVFF